MAGATQCRSSNSETSLRINPVILRPPPGNVQLVDADQGVWCIVGDTGPRTHGEIQTDSGGRSRHRATRCQLLAADHANERPGLWTSDTPPETPARASHEPDRLVGRFAWCPIFRRRLGSETAHAPTQTLPQPKFWLGLAVAPAALVRLTFACFIYAPTM
jgi:hypothetical protein